MPFSRRSVTAESRSPLVSSSARLQSIIPAPVLSRSSLTRFAEIAAAINSPPSQPALVGQSQPALIGPWESAQSQIPVFRRAPEPPPREPPVPAAALRAALPSRRG